MRPTYLLVIASVMATGFSDVPRRSADFMQHFMDEFLQETHARTGTSAPTRRWSADPAAPLPLVGSDGVLIPGTSAKPRDATVRVVELTPGVTAPRNVEASLPPASPRGSSRLQALLHAVKMRDWQHSIDHGAICLTRFDVIDANHWLPPGDLRSLRSALKDHGAEVKSLRRSLANCTAGPKNRRPDTATLQRVFAFERRANGTPVLFIL